MLCCTPDQALNSQTVTRLSNTNSSLSFFGACLLHTSHIGKLCRHLLLLFFKHFINRTSASTSRLPTLCLPRGGSYFCPSRLPAVLNWMPPSVGLNRQTCQLCNLKNRKDVKTKSRVPRKICFLHSGDFQKIRNKKHNTHHF